MENFCAKSHKRVFVIDLNNSSNIKFYYFIRLYNVYIYMYMCNPLNVFPDMSKLPYLKTINL